MFFMIQTTVKVSGMACSMCEAHINDAVRTEQPPHLDAAPVWGGVTAAESSLSGLHDRIIAENAAAVNQSNFSNSSMEKRLLINR